MYLPEQTARGLKQTLHNSWRVERTTSLSDSRKNYVRSEFAHGSMMCNDDAFLSLPRQALYSRA